MKKNNFIAKFLVVGALSLAIIMPCQEAFAWGWSRSHSDRHEVIVIGRQRYHYDRGRFYRPGFFGFVLVAPPLGAVIRVLPFGYRTVIVAGNPYYYYDDVYYRSCPQGYVVVPAPVVQTNIAGENIIINVPNSNGSYTAVKLVKHDNGYVGPQGEYYAGNPTVEQLKMLYGK